MESGESQNEKVHVKIGLEFLTRPAYVFFVGLTCGLSIGLHGLWVALAFSSTKIFPTCPHPCWDPLVGRSGPRTQQATSVARTCFLYISFKTRAFNQSKKRLPALVAARLLLFSPLSSIRESQKIGKRFKNPRRLLHDLDRIEVPGIFHKLDSSIFFKIAS